MRFVQVFYHLLAIFFAKDFNLPFFRSKILCLSTFCAELNEIIFRLTEIFSMGCFFRFVKYAFQDKKSDEFCQKMPMESAIFDFFTRFLS